MPDIRAILFDLDQTLTDRARSIEKVSGVFAAAFASRLGPLADVDLFAMMTALDNGGYAPKERFFAGLIEMLPWREPPTADHLTAFWRSEFPRCTVANSGAVEAIQELHARGILLAIVTNGQTAIQSAKIEELKIQKYISSISISEAVGAKKPDPRIFLHALESLKVTAEQAIFIGDHPINDIEGANALGMKAIWLRDMHAWPDSIQPPEYVVANCTEICDAIDRINSD